mgnify:CR=1 FL=1
MQRTTIEVANENAVLVQSSFRENFFLVLC